MHLSRRRLLLTAVLTMALGLSAASAATADTVIPFNNWTVSGSLTVAKLRQSVKLPSGSTFNGSTDLTTGTLTGDVNIPQFTAHLSVLGLPVNATLQFVEAKPVSGTVTLGSAGVTIASRASAFVRITRLSSPLVPLNLVGHSCQTSSPVVLPLNYSGPLTLSTGFTFTGTTTIPFLRNCGLATPLLNTLMAGPNNPFTVTIAPPA